jgi:hypothetical protein
MEKLADPGSWSGDGTLLDFWSREQGKQGARPWRSWQHRLPWSAIRNGGGERLGQGAQTPWGAEEAGCERGTMDRELGGNGATPVPWMPRRGAEHRGRPGGAGGKGMLGPGRTPSNGAQGGGRHGSGGSSLRAAVWDEERGQRRSAGAQGTSDALAAGRAEASVYNRGREPEKGKGPTMAASTPAQGRPGMDAMGRSSAAGWLLAMERGRWGRWSYCCARKKTGRRENGG